MKLFADQLLEEETFSSPVRAAAAQVIRPLCRAWLSLTDGDDLTVAFAHLREARTAVHEHFGTAPSQCAERSHISRESLRGDIFEAVISLNDAVSRYDEHDVDECLEPSSELRAAGVALEKQLRLTRLTVDGLLESSTARQCERYDRILHPERHCAVN
jgi:hypothetical protein